MCESCYTWFEQDLQNPKINQLGFVFVGQDLQDLVGWDSPLPNQDERVRLLREVHRFESSYDSNEL